MNKIKLYIEEVIKEMRKVNWPKQSELISNTAITLFASLVVSAFIYGVDQFISRALQFIYQ